MKTQQLTRRRLLKQAGALSAGLFAPVVWGKDKPDVLVLGAGLAGLYAAQLLESAGARVRVIEGNDRIGGRLHTLDDVPGAPEAGGQTIGPNYGRTLFLARQHGLELNQVNYALGREPVRKIYQRGGERLTAESWAGHPSNPFPKAYKAVTPDQIVMRALGAPPFQAPGQWLESQQLPLDVSVASFLAQQGFSREAIELAGLSNNYGRTLDESSLLFLHRNHQFVYQAMQTPGGSKTIKGGNQRLPEAMAKALRTPVATGKKITAINMREKNIVVSCEDGSVFTGDYAICALPFTTLRHIDIKPGLPKIRQEAVEKLSYGQVFQAHFAVRTPFWQGRGFLPNVWSDSLIEQVFASDPSNTGKITNLTVWLNGKGAEAVEGLPAGQAEKRIADDFYRILPEAKGATRLVKLYSWNANPFCRGSYATWAPGQITRYAKAVATPVGRLHFAGEHTAQYASGMEGALESGERSANEIVNKI